MPLVQIPLESLKAMRVHNETNRRKAIDMLFNIPRHDVSLALCESFRKTVDAMTTAIEPNASPQAKEHMRSAMSDFQALVEKERVVEEGELATIGDGVAVSPSES